MNLGGHYVKKIFKRIFKFKKIVLQMKKIKAVNNSTSKNAASKNSTSKNSTSKNSTSKNKEEDCSDKY